MADTGSIKPVNCAMLKLYHFDLPPALKGSETAKPSGMFCNPILNDKVITDKNVIFVESLINPLIRTPITNPSAFVVIWKLKILRSSM